MATLLYLGAHQGGSLAEMAGAFQRVIAFEANPRNCDILRARLPQVEVVHAAVCETAGTVAFNLSSNDGASSSLGTFRQEWLALRTDGLAMAERIVVPSVNLFDFCVAHGVDEIESYVSDLQGMDLTVLRTMAPYLARKKIRRIQCETTKDGFGNIYGDLPGNELRGFRELLEPHGYSLVGTGWGPLREGVFSAVPDDWWELDTLWSCPVVRPAPIISVCYTSARPSLIPRQVHEWLDRAHDREAIEFVVTIDAEAAAHAEALSQLPQTRVFVNHGRPCCVDGWNLAARKSRGDILIQCSDDLHPPARWDAAVRQRLNDGEGRAVLAIADGLTARADFIPHAILTRGYYNDFGYLFHDAYWSMWSDNEFTAVAHQRQAVVNGLDIIFGHSHGQIHDDVRARHEAQMQEGVESFRFREYNGFRPWKLYRFAPEDRDSDGIYAPNWSARPAVYWNQGPRDADHYLELHRQSAGKRAAMFGPQPQRPELQVLIPTIPARRQFLELLTAELTRQGVPFLIDDRTGVTVGEKRTQLMARATAPYLSFVDDDDWVSHNYGEIIRDAIVNNRHEMDAILYDMVTTVGDAMPRATILSFEHEHQDLEDCYLRLPNHIMVWKSDVARREPFAAINNFEDTDWARRMRAHPVRWARLRGFLYFYEFLWSNTATQR
jgi:FkbM family methyltransferase